MILEHTRENRMGFICLQFSSPFRVMDSFFSRTHKTRLRKISIERCVVWEAIKTKIQSLWSLENQNKFHRIFFL